VTIGNAGIATYTRRLDVLPADVNDDGVVNSSDLAVISANSVTPGALFVFADINGDGAVDQNDYTLARRRIGRTLP
jgi:hypothetical protein